MSDIWYLSVPKIMHCYWGGQYLSFLRFMTVYSFWQCNPDWEIHLYEPETVSTVNTWNRSHEFHDYKNIDYKNGLYKIPTIKRKSISDLKFIKEEYAEVHKSDLLRWYLLSKIGGLWSDMDILYFKPMTSLFCNSIRQRDTETFYATYKVENKHAIGFLMSNGKSEMFKMVHAISQESYISHNYQCFGADILNKYFRDTSKIKNSFNLQNDPVYFLQWNNGDLLFEKNGMNFISRYSIGLHWYAGHKLAKGNVQNINHTNFTKFNQGTIHKLLNIYYKNNRFDEYAEDFHCNANV